MTERNTYPRPCTKCGAVLDESGFSVKYKSTGRRYSECKSCDYRRRCKYVKEHRNAHNAYMREYYKKHSGGEKKAKNISAIALDSLGYYLDSTAGDIAAGSMFALGWQLPDGVVYGVASNPPLIEEKKCTDCGRTKPLRKFHLIREKSDRANLIRSHKCISCVDRVWST